MAEVVVKVEEIPEDDLDRDRRCSLIKCDKMARFRISRERTVRMWRPAPPGDEVGRLSTHKETSIFFRCKKHKPQERRADQ